MEYATAPIIARLKGQETSGFTPKRGKSKGKNICSAVPSLAMKVSKRYTAIATA